MDRLKQIARKSFAQNEVHSVLKDLEEASNGIRLDAYADHFLSDLGALLTLSPPMLDTLRLHPEYLEWLNNRVHRIRDKEDSLLPDDIATNYSERWNRWKKNADPSTDYFKKLQAFKRREYLLISYLDVAGISSFHDTVSTGKMRVKP